MSKYTPGPWIRHKRYGYSSAEIVSTSVFYEDATEEDEADKYGVLIASAYSVGCSAERYANEFLMAAAPEMLEHIKSRHDESHPYDDKNSCETCALIAKAEGK